MISYDRQHLFMLLQNTLAQELLGMLYVSPGPSASPSNSFEDFLMNSVSIDADICRKFTDCVKDFINDNDITFPVICLGMPEPEDTNVYILIDSVRYTVDDEQQYQYHSIIKNYNAAKAAKYLSQILAIPLSTAYEFAKKNRYLKLI